MPKRSPKVLLSQLKAGVSEDLPMKRIKRNPKKVVPGICDLPPELLEIIFGKIHICHQDCIRGTSKRMRDVSDMVVMREFKKAICRYTNHDPSSYKSAVLKVIEYATEVYVRAGFDSTFCGCILPMLRNTHNDPFCPRTRQIDKFLMHFYGMVDELLGGTCSQRSRLLYTLTLMRFFTKFDKTVVSSTTMPLYWRVIIELKGLWFGILWTPNSCYQQAKSSNILVILSEMLIAQISGKPFIRVWESPNEIYVFGNDTKNGKRVPKTHFTITVYGSEKICSFFRSCLEDPSDQFTWPSKWPTDQFTLNLDITCQEATKWGCSQSQHMEFGPFAPIEVCSETEQ